MAKRKTYKTIIILIFIITNIGLQAQDIHFSQFDNSPLNLNPALTGNFNNDYRVVANHRNQWSSITVPYKTFSFSFDSRIAELPIKDTYAGAGILFNTDKAGDASFGTNQIKLSGALHRLMKRDSSFVVSVGLNMAVNQNNINFNELYFGSQYNGSYYDPTSPSFETNPQANIWYFDIAAGVAIYQEIKEKYPIFYGITFTHINRPSQSFNNDDLVKLDMKFNTFVNSEFLIKDDFYALPSLSYYRQGKYNELNIGGLVRYNTTHYLFKKLYAGGWIRYKDAFITMIATDYQDFNIGLSYDFNISSLKIASRGLGGIELSVKYLFGKKVSYSAPFNKQCPVFM